MWVKLVCNGRCLTTVEGGDKVQVNFCWHKVQVDYPSHANVFSPLQPVYVKGCAELPSDDQDSQLWTSDRGFWVNKKTAQDRLKDGESAVQAPRRMIPNAVSQRWDVNGRTIHLRNKKDLVLTMDNETGSLSIRKPAQDDDSNQQWELVAR
ncbi:hypothetical protein NQZ79_g6449 [Umbelopsis isabellina]|nr:hypothetical protein NQZ79_g6449 [Umbelopsis isabellina]